MPDLASAAQTGPLPGARFDHVAHAAASIRRLLPTYRDLLGGTFCAGGDNSRVGYRAVVLSFPAGGRIELMEPLPGSSFFASFFRRQPAGGLHHVTYYVDSLEASVASAEVAGLEVFGEWRQREDYQEAFVHPRSNAGVLLQLVQVGAGYRAMGADSTLDDVLAGRP